MKVMNQMIAIVSVIGLCATAACDRRSPVSPEAADPVAAAPTAAAAAESSNASDRAQPSVFTAACDITAALTDFRTALGPLNPNVVGEQNGGRREVNWDAVPPAFTNTLTFPGDFFNQNFSPRARGVVFSTDGTGLSVSDNDFAFINPAYDAQFNSFSPIRTFSAIESAETRVDLFVAGTETPARSTGFGVVFSDVDEHGVSVDQAARREWQQPGCVPRATLPRRLLVRRRPVPDAACGGHRHPVWTRTAWP